MNKTICKSIMIHQPIHENKGLDCPLLYFLYSFPTVLFNQMKCLATLKLSESQFLDPNRQKILMTTITFF